MKNELDNLLQQEMDRKSFLKLIGVGIVALTGVATIVKTLSSVASPAKRTSGYGSSSYGGSPKFNS